MQYDRVHQTVAQKTQEPSQWSVWAICKYSDDLLNSFIARLSELDVRPAIPLAAC